MSTPEREALIEKVAEAIRGETSGGRIFPWNTLTETEKDPWRRMANAAFDVLIERLGSSVLAACLSLLKPPPSILSSLGKKPVPVLTNPRRLTR
ncbi:hypothetical protein ROCKYHORROR_92 [Mycobacterium phage RockyHorror]|uniref:Uncharacterized protein n=1 Tax=Mycobacterium phage RockyHorror TaxID=2920892 RepID=G1BTM3_9CAUD|nr:hypothetical protein FGG57_gp092 [Mycobacterium phage RockyHorror]AEK06795.1 hypothetical protein ROCKYHORROR_92 [Mycobacterium phage RockyHorror]